ncbi:MAG: c-type cytochrome [Nitrospirae bacterium]|nr:c-type cytochrome [Nitrospirota bacterium]NTW67122.1 c-type cytochrome [Nitrospirota bacterium]
MEARRILDFGTMRNARRAGFVALAVLMLIALMTAAGLHAGTTAAGTVPAGKEVKNPFEGRPEAIKEGDKIFDTKCSECHMDGTGGAGPNLTDDTWIYGGSDAEVFETISGGRKGGMPSWKGELSKDDIWKVIAFIRSIAYKK